MDINIHHYVHYQPGCESSLSSADEERLHRLLSDAERNTIRLEQVAKALKRLDRQTL